MKKIAVITAGLLVVAMSSGLAYADSTGNNNANFASKQTMVDPSRTDQAKGADAQAQDEQQSTDNTTAGQNSKNKKTSH